VDRAFPFRVDGVDDGALAGFYEKAFDAVFKRVSNIITLLNRVDEVIVSRNYESTLAALDRGAPVSKPLEVTVEKYSRGVAMTPKVTRGGVTKVVVVFSEEIFASLGGEDDTRFFDGVHTIAHELAHASETEIFDDALPGVLMSPFDDTYEGELYPCADSAWNEYYAERVSAKLSPYDASGWRGAFISALEHADELVKAARSVYAQTSNLNDLFPPAAKAIGRAMKFAGYFLGHADGQDGQPNDDSGVLAEALDRFELRSWFDGLHADLRALFDRAGQWTSFDEFLVLNRRLEEALNHYLIFPERTDDGGMFVGVEWNHYTLENGGL
jgi:hypothetical protein